MEDDNRITKQSIIYTCDPLYQVFLNQNSTIDKNTLIETQINLSNVVTTINTLKIDPNSPKTKKALELCNIPFESIVLRDMGDFRKRDEFIQLTEKRYLVHQLQIARLRKQVILKRNQLKNQERANNKRSISVLDQSWSSAQHSDQLKSPTEVVENWIETHFSRSNKYLAKLNQIKQVMICRFQQKENEEKQQQEQQVKFVEIFQKQTERKQQRRMNLIQEKKERARELNSKSMEIRMKMNQLSKERLKQSLQKKEIDQKTSLNLEKRIEQLKLKFSQQIDQRKQEYNEKQQRAVQIKQESELTKSTVAKLQLLKTERNHTNADETSKKSGKKQSSVDTWSVRLPNILLKNEKMYQDEFQNNLVYVVNKFKRNFSQRSLQSLHTRDDSLQKIEQQRQRYSSKLEYYNNRSQLVQDKLKKKDDYIATLNKQKQNNMDLKFTKLKNQMNENETRHEQIRKQYQDKLTQQLEKKLQKHRSNINLMKQKEQAIEGLKHLRQFDKSKSMLSCLKSTK